MDEKDKPNRNRKLSDEDNEKLGEIIIKNSKYYFKPNLKQITSVKNNNNDDKSEISSTIEYENLSWLVYKGIKIPSNKSRYCIKEGDVLKLGREWLLIKDICISDNTKSKLKTSKKSRNGQSICLSYHTQTNHSLNLNRDFDRFENNVTEEENDNCEEDDNDKEKEDKDDPLVKTNNCFRKNRKAQTNIKGNKNDLISCNGSEKYFGNNKNNKKNKRICRICYMEEIDKKGNPLIKPCKCSGSMKYIHYECLLHWLKTKVIINRTIYNKRVPFSIFSLDLIECELCKNHLPNYIRHNNKIYSLIDVDKSFDEEPKKPNNKEKKGDLAIFNKKTNEKLERNYNYIIFDSVTPGKSENKYRYLVKFDSNNNMKIGRGLEMQLILNDISVSRNHCQLKIGDDGNIIMEDNNSKFGSLVLLQAEMIEILKGQTLTIQVGTNYLNISLKKKSNIFGCCNAEEIDIKHSYERINSKAIKYDKTIEVLNESITPENSDNEEKDDKEKEGKEKENKKKIKKDLIDKKDKDIKIKNEEINMDNKNIKNNNFDSTYVGSTLFAKDNINEEEKKNDVKLNKKFIQKGIGDAKNKKNSIQSENIIVSESDIDKNEENRSNNSKNKNKEVISKKE